MPRPKLRLMPSSRSVETDLDDGAGGTMTSMAAWSALRAFSHFRRLADAALFSANRFLDEPVRAGPGVFRREPVATASGGSL